MFKPCPVLSYAKDKPTQSLTQNLVYDGQVVNLEGRASSPMVDAVNVNDSRNEKNVQDDSDPRNKENTKDEGGGRNRRLVIVQATTCSLICPRQTPPRV